MSKPTKRAVPPRSSTSRAKATRPLHADTTTAPADERYVALQGRGTLTIPADLRRIMHLDLPGAMAQLVLRPDGVLEIRPKIPVDADQAWFWTERWQQMEREADQDLAAGRVSRFDDADEFLTSLDAL